LLPQQYQSVRSTEGSIIGTQKATRLHDIALLSTVLEAAKFQKVRSVNQNNGNRFQISRTDLLSYRRTPTPKQMLVVVLDYTCLQECAWEDAILPHLSWAYVTRASVSVIQVGSSRAKNYLRAEQITERSLLSPRIAAAFEEQVGIATPLAHGLDLAIRTLRTALQHGRGRVQQARLVVISDGRGNVPLAASRAGELNHPVYREGIEDALEVAKGLTALKQIETLVLNPQPKQYADLPVILAEALGVIPEPIGILAPEEVKI
jgi:magnesium chelatase subunit D